jgi:hypothetical protein
MIPAAVIQLQIMSGHKQGATQWHNNKQHHSGSLTVKNPNSQHLLVFLIRINNGLHKESPHSTQVIKDPVFYYDSFLINNSGLSETPISLLQ